MVILNLTCRSTIPPKSINAAVVPIYVIEPLQESKSKEGQINKSELISN
jgi:hypothetical protein